MCQQIFAISYRFQDNWGQRCFGGGAKKIFFIGFWWGFLQMLPLEKCNKTLPKDFLPSFTVFQVKGVERGQKMPSRMCRFWMITWVSLAWLKQNLYRWKELGRARSLLILGSVGQRSRSQFLKIEFIEPKFGPCGKFLFFIRFRWDFFHWIPLNECFHTYSIGFLLSLTVFKIIGVKGVGGRAKKMFFFIFHWILMGFFANASSWKMQ